MAEEAHFTYQSEVSLKKGQMKMHQDSADLQVPIRVDIKSVKFMVPVQIEFEIVNTITDEIVGEKIAVGGGVDIANQELTLQTKFPDQVAEHIRKSVFAHIFSGGALAEDQFEAGEEVYSQAERAKEEHDNLQDQNLGGK